MPIQPDMMVASPPQQKKKKILPEVTKFFVFINFILPVTEQFFVVVGNQGRHKILTEKIRCMSVKLGSEKQPLFDVVS